MNLCSARATGEGIKLGRRSDTIPPNIESSQNFTSYTTCDGGFLYEQCSYVNKLLKSKPTHVMTVMTISTLVSKMLKYYTTYIYIPPFLSLNLTLKISGRFHLTQRVSSSIIPYTFTMKPSPFKILCPLKIFSDLTVNSEQSSLRRSPSQLHIWLY